MVGTCSTVRKRTKRMPDTTVETTLGFLRTFFTFDFALASKIMNDRVKK